MEQEQEKYDPVILNLSKSRAIKQPKNYFWLFLTSLILLGALLLSSAWYVLFYSGKTPAPNGGEQIPDVKATVAVAEPTATPTASPTPTMAPVPEDTPAIVSEMQVTPEVEMASGYLSLNSVPDQADVIIDGELLGQTPLKDYELEAGEYSVTFAYNGESVTHAFSIKAGERTEYTHRFEGLGSLQITTTSSGCDVYLNGQLRGKSPLSVEGLPPGEYTIVLKKVGYHTTEKQLSLGQGEHQELFLTIKRLGSRSSSGSGEPSSRPLHPSERLRN